MILHFKKDHNKPPKKQSVSLLGLEDIHRIEEFASDNEECQEWQEEASQIDIFQKEKEEVTLEKVQKVRELQKAIENSEKWMWKLKKENKFKGFAQPKRSLEQYGTLLEDALTIGYVLEEVGRGG